MAVATAALARPPAPAPSLRDRRRRRPALSPARGLRSTLAASLSPRRNDQENDHEDDQENADPTALPAAIVVTGFSPDECAYCRGVLGLPVVAATPRMLSAPLEAQAALAAAELDAALVRDAAAEARAEEEDGADSEDSDDSFFSSSSAAAAASNDDGATTPAPSSATADPAALALGRTALFVGDPSFAAACASSLNDALASAELWPAVVAAAPPKHAARPLQDALLAIREAHARRHRLVQPLRVDPALAAIPQEPGAALVMNLEIDSSEAVPVSATASAAAAVAAAGAAASSSTSGGALASGASGTSQTPLLTRRDASHVVVLDGLLTEDERAELYAALTAPGHDPAQPPPSDKWEARLVDRAGEPPTWGLKASAIRSLLRDPPNALVALQSRLAALYPEYTLCAMPAAAMRGGADDDDDDDGNMGPYVGGGDDDDDPAFTAPLVANAVAPADPCAWHVDADPSLIPADAPFSLHYGPYFNREPGLPLFVSILLYLNPEWQDDWHAETLFLDPASGVGAFTSAKPGRCVLMEQDISHRIGAPSAVRAPGLRYSLVLKTVWMPKDGGVGLGSNGISRPEWGAPQALGSASRAIGPRGREVVVAAQ
jgi:probable phosphoglycerate mutase